MSSTITFNGVSYSIPATGDQSWGDQVSAYLIAIASGALQKSGGTFTLTAEVDFGATFGLKSAYFKSRSSNAAGAGAIRLASTDVIKFRNNANGADVALGKDTSDQLTWAGAAFVSSTGTILDTSLPALTGDVTSSAGSAVTTVAKIAGVSVGTPTGTGNVVMSASPTLTGTVVAANITASGNVSVSGTLTTGNPLTVGAFAGNASSLVRRANGSSGSPSAVLSGQTVGIFGSRGYGATGYIAGNGIAIEAVATQDYTDSNGGTKLNFYTTPNGSISPIRAMTIDQDKAISMLGTLAVTGVTTLTAQPIVSSLTASLAVFTDGSKGLVSNAITGTGNVVMSASPTLTGTITAASQTLSGTLGVTGVATFTAQPIMSSLTASLPVFSDGSKGLVSNAMTGTGNVVMSASPTLTGTITAASQTLSGTLGVTGVATFTAQPIVSSLTASLPVFSDGSKGLVSNAMTGTGNVVMSASPTLTGTVAGAASTWSSTVTGAAFISGSSNSASAGTVRLASTDTIKWRNNANGADVSLAKDTSDQLSWAGTSFLSSAGVLLAAAHPALTGDVTSSAGSVATTVAKIQTTVVSGTTGSGNVVFSASPTLTGTIAGANQTLSGTLGVTGVATFTAKPVMSSLTASLPVFTDGSKGLVSNAITGSGSVVMSASPTITGALTVVAGGATGVINITSASGATHPTWSIAAPDTSLLIFDNAASSAIPLVMDYTGKVGIGTTPNGNAQLDVRAPTNQNVLQLFNPVSLPHNFLYCYDGSNNVMAEMNSAGHMGLGAALGSGFDLEVTHQNSGCLVVATGYGNATGGNFIGRNARGTYASPSATLTDDAIATFAGRGYGDTGFASGRRGAFRIRAAQDWTDSAHGTYATIEVTPNGSTTVGTALTIANDSAATFAGTVAASNLSGTNSGDITLATVGSSPANAGASLSGQVLTLQPADSTHGGVVSTTTQTFAGDKTISGATTPLSIEIAGNSATVAAQIKSTGNFTAQLSLDSNRSTNGNTLGSLRGLWNGTVVGSIVFLAATTASGAKDDGKIAFFTRPGGGTNTQRMTIDETGLVGINMTPARQLDVSGTFGATGASQFGSTLGVTGLLTPTAGIKGVSTNTNATAGNIGEYIESVVAATNYPTSTQYGDITSISLTAGDWDVTAAVESTLNGATATVATELGISTTSGNSATGLVAGSNWIHTAVPTSTRPQGHCIPSYRISLAATTTVYMKALATYTGGPPQLAGRLSARRVQPGA